MSEPLLGMLMLVLMVGAFAAITRIERAASTNYVDGERAKFIAWSGVERAKYELRRAPCTPPSTRPASCSSTLYWALPPPHPRPSRCRALSIPIPNWPRQG